MSSLSLLRVARLAPKSISARSFTTASRAMAEGDTGSGASRPGGSAQGDAFSKREKASEDLYVREQEQAKLRSLLKKLEEKKKDLDDVHKELNDLAGKN